MAAAATAMAVLHLLHSLQALQLPQLLHLEQHLLLLVLLLQPPRRRRVGLLLLQPLRRRLLSIIAESGCVQDVRAAAARNALCESSRIPKTCASHLFFFLPVFPSPRSGPATRLA